MHPAATRAAIALAAAVVALGDVAAGAASRPATVAGSAVSPACVEPSTRDYDPATNHFECDALEQLSGDWTGTGHLHALGTVDPLSGDAKGRFTDVLDVTVANGSSATVRVVGTLAVDGATGNETLRGRLEHGTGALRGAHGWLVLTGTSPATGGPSIGNYQGRWQR
jgi:hypothetical protein